MAAVDYFLKIDGIPGGSTDDKHKGEIDIMSFSWGATNPATALAGGGGAGRVQLQPLRIAKATDMSSANLFLKCATGQHLKSAVLTANTVGEQPIEFLKITLSDVLVSSYSVAGASPGSQETVNVPVDAVFVSPNQRIAGAGVPADAVSLSYRSAQFNEGPQQHIAVTPSATGTLAFDPKTGLVSFVEGPADVMTVGSVNGAIQRGVQEFDVASFIGLLTAPFGTAKLRLLVTEVREAATNPGAAIASVDAARPGRQKPGRFDVILYTPADLTITTDDLTRKGTRIGTITVDPNADPASLTIDLTQLEQHRRLGAFGIRLQLRGAPIPKLYEEGDDENDPDVEQPVRADGEDDGGTGQPVSAASFTLDLVFDSA